MAQMARFRQPGAAAIAFMNTLAATEARFSARARSARRPEDAMSEAMLRGWRAQQVARGLREESIAARERLMRRFSEFTGEYPWNWKPGHVDEWSLSLTAEHHLAPSTIRAYQCSLRQF